MKVGILTTHDEINYGAYLQAFALQKVIESLGVESFIIDYKKISHSLLDYKSFLMRKNPILGLMNLFKILAFKKAQKKFKMSRYIHMERSINGLGCDAIVLGSDEIWNFKNCLNGVFVPAHYSIGINADKIVSYAPSFGSVDYGSEIPSEIKNGLSRIHSISVRDFNSKKIINTAIARGAEVVLDPTLLYDFSGLEDDIGIDVRDYILVYLVGRIDKTAINEIKGYARRHDKTLISVGYYNSWCDNNVLAADPLAWIAYVKNASYVVTDMFHGSIFSVKYRKNFCCILSEYRKNKLGFLIKDIFKLDQCLWDITSPIASVLDSQFDYETVERRIGELRAQSMFFLKGALLGESLK